MGQRILLSCESCGCKKEMSVGAGLMSNNPDIIASCLSKEEGTEWRQLYDRQKIDSFHAQQKVFYCEDCNDLFCQLTVDTVLTDGKEIIFGDKCKKCGNKLQEVSLEAHHTICPRCKVGDLSWKQVGFWD